MKRVLGICALAWSLFAGEPTRYTVEGFVPNNTGSVRVLVLSVDGRDTLGGGDVSANGAFEVRGIPAGLYRVAVVSLSGEVLGTESVSVPAFSPLEIRLSPNAARPQGPVSMYRLSHRAPKEARKLLDRALKCQKSEEEEDLLERSLLIDPGYLAALERLAILRLKQSRAGDAVGLLDRMIELDGSSVAALINGAVAHQMLGEDGRARELAERALSFDPDNTRAHYLLGLSLVRMGQRDEATLQHLKKAAVDFPRARSFLDKLR